MKAGDRVKFVREDVAVGAGVAKDAVGVVTNVFEPAGNLVRVDVKFEGVAPVRGIMSSQLKPAES